MMNSSKTVALCLCAIAAPLAWADGPYWQIPNPDAGDADDIAAAAKGETGTNRNGKPVLITAGGRPLDFRSNPANFLKCDDKLRDYYVRHSAIKNDPDPTKFYLQIVHRAAQAMREVNTYEFPNDCFPMWHEEADRERMIVYAQRTWELAGQLPAETAAACAELAVECYIDSIRFRQEARKKDGLARQHTLMITRMQKLLTNSGADPTLRNYSQATAVLHQWLVAFTADYKSFGPWKDAPPDAVPLMGWVGIGMTGDIPLQGDDAETRMADALLRMGALVLRSLEPYTKHANPAVAKAAQALCTRFGREAKPLTYDEVLAQVRSIVRGPDTLAAKLAMDRLKTNGMAGAVLLARVLYHEEIPMRQAALSVLRTISGKDFGFDAERWKAYGEKYEQEHPAKMKAAPKKAAATEDDSGFEIKKRPGYVEPADDE